MKLYAYLALATLGCAFTFSTTAAIDQKNEPRLLRLPYKSVVDDLERDYFLYLPSGYEENSSKEWPVLVFLHGDGQRGNGCANDQLMTPKFPKNRVTRHNRVFQWRPEKGVTYEYEEKADQTPLCAAEPVFG
jgi:hypothetical protein